MRVILVAALAVLVASCAPARPGMEELTLPPKRIIQRGYSLVPLNESGWLVGYRDAEKLILGKRASDPDENMIIRAFGQVLPPLKSEQEFMIFAKSVLIMEGATRHKLISQEVKPLVIKGQSCAKTSTTMEDHGAVKQSSRADYMILEAISVLCKHPNNRTGVVIAYSHRYYPGHNDPDSASKAQKIFDSIEFPDL